MKFISLLAIAGAAVAQVYVSPSGDDRNPGTAARPVQTLPHARDLARTRKGAIVLSGGTYRLTAPLMLDAEDSGETYQAAPGQHPVISGGVPVTGWKIADRAKNLWAAPAPGALRNTRQLYVSGIRAPRTRGRLPVTVTQTSTGYIASGPAMSQWRNPSDIEFIYTGGNSMWSEPSLGLGGWTEPRCPVASIDGVTISMAQPCWDNSTRRVMYADPAFKRTANLVGPAGVGKQPASVENAFELLGTPGQWYFDRPARTIYYTPRAGEDMRTADVEAPVIEALVAGAGTADQPIHDITFSGIEFSYATWLGPSSGEGFSEIQANYIVTGVNGYATQGLCKLAPGGACPYGAWTKAPGNVSFHHGRQIRFVNDTFVHLGGAGLNLDNGSQNDVVEGSVFTDISGDGFELGNVDLPLATGGDVTSGNRVSNNHFYNVGAEFRGGIPIVVGYAQNTRIEHNQIDHIPYAAISMGWGGWPDKVHMAGQPNFSANNVVSDNLIFDLMLVLADGGGIYTQGLTGKSLAEGEKVTGNVIYRQFSSGHGIYTDNGSCNITVSNNVIFETNFDNWGSRHADWYDGADGKSYDPLLIEDNYWQQGDADTSVRNVTERGNRLISSLREAPAAILDHAGIEPAFRDVLTRRIGGDAAPEPPSRVAAAPGDGTAWVTWSPPVFEGGAPVESYTVTASNGPQATITAADFRTFAYVKLPGLVNGSDTTFTVTARNTNGTSVPSLPSRPIVPRAEAGTVPGPPQKARALAGNGKVSLHFQAPAPVKGEKLPPILSYVVTISPGGRKVSFTGRGEIGLDGTHTTFGVIDGLKTGETYTFGVAAVNPFGEGAMTMTAPVTIR